MVKIYKQTRTKRQIDLFFIDRKYFLIEYIYCINKIYGLIKRCGNTYTDADFKQITK